MPPDAAPVDAALAACAAVAPAATAAVVAPLDAPDVADWTAEAN